MQKTNDVQTTSRNWKKIIAILIMIIAVIYVIGAIYFNKRYLYGTKIGDKKIGGKSLAQVEKILEDDASAYKLSITGRKGLKDSIKGTDIDLQIKVGDSLRDAVKQQNSFVWFLGASEGTKQLTTDVTYNETKLKKEIRALDCFKKDHIIAPKNATIIVKKKKFVVQKEVWGTTVKRAVLTQKIKECLPAVDTDLDLRKADCYKNPTILKDDARLQNGIKQANKIANVTITYDFKYTTETVDIDKIQHWIIYDKDMNAKLSYQRVLRYIEELAKKYDTYSTVRTVKDAGGTEHKVYFGSYGWKISQTKEAKKLMKVILAGKNVTREPIYMYKAVCRKEGNVDWDDTYALVNIQNQSMVFIKNGKVVVSSSVVTGDPTKGHSTPTGAYSVMYKERNKTLVGQGYASPVSYWMPFTTNVGFHDASWRGSFGGGGYRGNGSHGCVNMPGGNAAALYSVIEPGTPVFVY